MLISRAFAVCAAVTLVLAFGLFLLTPDDMTLAQGAAVLDPNLPRALQGFIRHVLGPRAWVHVALPVLARPVWLLPLSAGLVFAGCASSFAPRGESAERFRGRG